MNIEGFRSHCLAKKGVKEEFPFGEDIMVMKVMGKMFALTDVNHFESINLKCEPEAAIELREKYAAVEPGYHMSKKHWNTILMDGSIPDKLLKQWIDNSYQLVVASLPQKVQSTL